jgi:hypothetical protein
MRQSSAAAVRSVRLTQGSIPVQPMLLPCADATGSVFAWRHELAGKRANELNSFRSVREIQAGFRYDQAGN